MNKISPDRLFSLITQKDGKASEKVLSMEIEETDFIDCQHDSKVILDKNLRRIECAKCGKTLDPIQFLIRVSDEVASAVTWIDEIKTEYRLIDNLLKNRTHTKCEHCGKQTKITGLGW